MTPGQAKYFAPWSDVVVALGPGGNLSFQDTGLCHSNRKSTTHKSGEISQKYTHKSGEISQKYTHKSGEFFENHTHKSGKCKKLLKNIPINPENAKIVETIPINPESIVKKVP